MTILNADAECSPANDDFEITIKREADRVVLCVRGELDLATAPVLKRYLAAAQSDGSGDVSLDLGALTFIDSSGVETIVAAARVARAKRQRFSLRQVPHQPMRVLEITGLTERVLIEH